MSYLWGTWSQARCKIKNIYPLYPRRIINSCLRFQASHRYKRYRQRDWTPNPVAGEWKARCPKKPTAPSIRAVARLRRRPRLSIPQPIYLFEFGVQGRCRQVISASAPRIGTIILSRKPYSSPLVSTARNSFANLLPVKYVVKRSEGAHPFPLSSSAAILGRRVLHTATVTGVHVRLRASVASVRQNCRGGCGYPAVPQGYRPSHPSLRRSNREGRRYRSRAQPRRRRVTGQCWCQWC